MQLSCLWFRPVTPLGDRCKGREYGASGPNRWVFHEDCKAEIERLRRNDLDPKLSPTEHKDYWMKLYRLLSASASGLMSDVEWDRSLSYYHNLFLSLKPTLDGRRPAFGRKARLLRLYFGEPQAETDTLWGLQLATKEDSPDGRDEQDEAIVEARNRAEKWATPTNFAKG